jgi:hypothetical protein
MAGAVLRVPADFLQNPYTPRQAEVAAPNDSNLASEETREEFDAADAAR